MVYIKELNLVWVHVPKAAGSSVQRALKAAGADYAGPAHLTLDEICESRGITEPPEVAACVRRPEDRVVSACRYVLRTRPELEILRTPSQAVLTGEFFEICATIAPNFEKPARSLFLGNEMPFTTLTVFRVEDGMHPCFLWFSKKLRTIIRPGSSNKSVVALDPAEMTLTEEARRKLVEVWGPEDWTLWDYELPQ